MAITFRHDAAGVVPPSNASTRKYGQSLVLQQQQQKYDSQQAGYDRMFDAYKMENQNQIQQQRDWQQRDFVLNRDRDQNKLQQQQQRAADFTAARARMDTYAKDALSNPDLPPQLRQQIQNLVSGKMVAMGSGFNETQQQQFLDQYNAELAKLLSEVPAPKPQPTASDKFNQRKHFDEESGQWFIENSKGDFVPVVDPRQQQQQEKLQQQQLQQQEQEAEKMRPKSMEEYYSDNEDKFQKDLDSTMDRMQKDYDLDPTKPAPTRESALKKMQDDYDFRQQALGKPQYGEPTLAKPYGQALEEARKLPGNEYHQLADMNEKLLELENRFKSLPKDSAERKKALNEYHTERDRIINGGAQPAPEMRSILEQPGQQPTPAAPAPSTPTPVASQSSLDQLDALAEANRIPQGRFYGNDSYTNNAMDQAFKSLSNGKAPSQQAATIPAGPAASAAAPSQNVSQPAPPQPGQEGGAANYPWLKQPGKLMSENKAGQASSPITIETASVAAKQYEAASQQLQTLQSQAAAMDAKIQSLQGRTGRSGVRSTQTNQEIARLKKERQQLNLGIRSAQNTMQASDKSVRGYYDQEVAKQPAVQALAKAGKRPQDFAQAEFQLKNLRMQYPDMSTMPAEAKKQLKEAMAIIQAGR